MNKEIYVVKEVEGKDGLTVGSRVLSPGKKFSKDPWPYGDEALKEAIKNGRCELEEKKPEVKKADAPAKQEPAKGGKASKKADAPETDEDE